MLIHLTPRMYACRLNEPCTLVDLKCDELGLSLKGGQDLTARRPYPNKNYLVACRKIGQKAMDGILIETLEPMREFTVVTRWAVAASHIARHCVRYVVLDDEYDTISENMALWGNLCDDLGAWRSRYPAHLEYGSPVRAQPRMDVFPRLAKEGVVREELNRQGALIERMEVFRLPTLERERLLDTKRSVIDRADRTPPLEAAFPAGKNPNQPN